VRQQQVDLFTIDNAVGNLVGFSDPFLSPFHNPALVGGLTKAAQKNAPRDDVREQASRGRISAPQGTARALLRKNVSTTHESTTLLVHPSNRPTFTNLSVGRGSSSTQRRLRSRPRTAAPPSLLIVLFFKTRKHELYQKVHSFLNSDQIIPRVGTRNMIKFQKRRYS